MWVQPWSSSWLKFSNKSLRTSNPPGGTSMVSENSNFISGIRNKESHMSYFCYLTTRTIRIFVIIQNFWIFLEFMYPKRGGERCWWLTRWFNPWSHIIVNPVHWSLSQNGKIRKTGSMIMTQQARRSGLAWEPGPQRERLRANNRNALCSS